jgi:hypothetical protein
MAAAAVATFVLLAWSTQRTVNEIVAYATVFGVAIALYTAFKPDGKPSNLNDAQYEETVRALADRVTHAEGLQRQRLLDLALEPAPTGLRAAETLASYRIGFQPLHTDLPRLFDVFWRLRPRRLVLLGEAGAGKTLLLLELIKQAADARRDLAVPVLMRFNIAEWRGDQSFSEYLTEKVSAEQVLPADLVKRMLADGRIIPLLDGLDECDSEGSSPVRGFAALRRLNTVSDDSYPLDAPLIITCRRQYFDRLENLQLQEGVTPGLIGAGCLMIQSLSADQIMAYLRLNLTEEARNRWRPVLRALGSVHPNTVVSNLARTLGSPWRLMLAFRAYANYGVPESLLSGANVSDIEARLLPQFLESAIQQGNGHSKYLEDLNEPQHEWVKPLSADRAKVSTWLKHIAQYLERDRDEGGGAGEFILFQIYRMVDQKLLRGAFAACILIAAAAIGMLIAFAALNGPHPFARTVATCGAVAFLAGGVYIAIFKPPDTPAGASVNREVRTREGLLDLSISFLCGLVASVFTLGTDNTLGARIIGGICCGFLAALFFGFVHSRRVRARGTWMVGVYRPTDPLQGGLWDSSIIGLLVALVYGLILVFDGAGVVMALIFALCTLIVFAPVLGMPVTSVAWSRYRLATMILFIQRRLPWRLATFLQWNYEVGIMRVSGLAYQFRHLRLQEWLAETSEQRLLPQKTVGLGERS